MQMQLAAVGQRRGRGADAVDADVPHQARVRGGPVARRHAGPERREHKLAADKFATLSERNSLHGGEQARLAAAWASSCAKSTPWRRRNRRARRTSRSSNSRPTAYVPSWLSRWRNWARRRWSWAA